MRITPNDPAYPARLRDLGDPPIITISGPLHAARTVAIVGSRSPKDFARSFARDLAFELAKAGVTIVSGGALGVDTAAHRGAIDAGGATWVINPCGRRFSTPDQNRRLFDEIVASDRSRMIWPFSDDMPVDRKNYLSRNKVLVALAEVVVVVQARPQSGSVNAMRWAESLERPLYVLPGLPDDFQFAASHEALRKGARPLYGRDDVFDALELPRPPPRWANPDRPPGRAPVKKKPAPPPRAKPPQAVADESWSREEKTIFSALSSEARHIDQLVESTGLGASATVTALLTLSLKDVVVEGPGGFFRRATTG